SISTIAATATGFSSSRAAGASAPDTKLSRTRRMEPPMRAIRGLRRLTPVFPARTGARLAIGLLAGVTAAMPVPAAAAQADGAVRFDIPAQDLAGALDQYARRLDIQIL